MGYKERVVFVFRDMGTGGSQKIEAFVANTLFKNDYEVFAINMSPSECSVDIDTNIPVYDLFYRDTKNSNKVKQLLFKLKYLVEFRKLVKSINADIVCSFLSDVVRITVIALMGLNVSIIGSERGDPFYFSEKQFRKYKKAYSKCDGVVFQLPLVREKYCLNSTIKQGVIYNPCIPRKDSFNKRTICDSKIILGAGRLVDQKRFDLLIDAFAISNGIDMGYRLVICGDGPLKETLIDKINSLNIGNYVELVGDVENVFDEMCDSEFFVLSSDYEGIPNVIMEAMAIGMPCISTDCSPGGARLLLDNGDKGLIVPCGDIEGLKDAINYYIANQNERELFAIKGLDVVDLYSKARIEGQWVKFFDEI